MKRLMFFVLLGFEGVLPLGCTAPTQPIAMNALLQATRGESDVIHDFINLTQQAALDQAVADATARPAEVKTIIEVMGHKYEQVLALVVRHERNVQLLVIAKLYIGSQRGIGNILWDEVKEASAKVKAREQPTAVPQTKPAPQTKPVAIPGPRPGRALADVRQVRADDRLISRWESEISRWR